MGIKSVLRCLKVMNKYLLIVLVSTRLMGQVYSPEILHISINEGLSQSTVTDIIQDKNGFLWIGTQDGLNKYDGYTFKSFNSVFQDSTTLSNNLINSMVFDEAENLWLATQIGLTKFNTKKGAFTRYIYSPDDPASLHDNVVNDLVLDGNTMWLATSNGLARLTDIDKPVFEQIENSNKREKLIISSLQVDDQGNIWIVSGNNGLYIYNDSIGQISRLRYNKELKLGRNVRCIKFLRNQLWIGTNDALVVIDNPQIDYNSDPNGEALIKGRFEKYKSGNPLYPIENGILCIQEDSDHVIWLGTDSDGVYRLNAEDGLLEPYLVGYKQNPEAFRTTSVNKIFEDYLKNIWIGTLEAGIYKIRRSSKKFGLMRSIPGNASSLSSNRVRGLLEVDDHLWIATARGLNRFNRSSLECKSIKHNPTSPVSLSNNDVKVVCEDRLGFLWVGTDKGLNRIEPKSMRVQRFYAGDLNQGALITNNKIRTVRSMRDGSVWVGTLGGGISVIDPAKLKNIQQFENDVNEPASISNNNIMNIFEASDGKVWVATYGGGLNLLIDPEGTFKRYQIGDNFLFSRLLTSIHEDTDGTLWIGSYGDGLCHFDPIKNEHKVYSENTGLSNNVVYCAVPYENDIWISTNYGLNKIDKITGSVSRYDVYDGLQSNEFNSASYLKSKTGELFFGGVEGLTFFHPDSIDDNDLPVKIAFTDFKVFNKSVSPDEIVISGEPLLSEIIADSSEVNLSYFHNVFTIEFAAIDYTSPDDNQYAYQLVGFDKDWVYEGEHQRAITYTNLTPGKYTFQVKGANNDGMWNERPSVIFINIRPAFWQLLWFRILAGLIIVSTIVLIVNRRINKTERRRRYLESKVEERTLELSEQKQLVEHQNEELRQSEGRLKNINKKKDQMFYILAHNVRSPLTTLLSLMNLFNNNNKSVSTDEMINFSKQIKQDAEDSLLLLDNSLYWSMIQFNELSVSQKKLNITKLIENAIAIYGRDAAEKNVSIGLQSPSEFFVQADEKLTKVIVQNLISNALKFSYEGEKVKISISESEELLEIAFENTGREIESDRMLHLFDPDKNTVTEGTKKEKGTGLGLVVSKKLAEIMDFDITVERIGSNQTKFLLSIKLSHP